MSDNHRSTSVEPDCSEIEKRMDEVIKLRNVAEKQKPKSHRVVHSRTALLREAGYESGTRILKIWRLGKSWPNLERLTDLADVLDCEVKQLRKHAPVAFGDANTPEEKYADLVITSLLTIEFETYAREAGGYQKAEVKGFVDEFRFLDVYELGMTEQRKDLVLDDVLCRQGWLERERNSHPPRFFLRPWTKRQCKMALECRVVNEAVAACAAAALRYVSAEEDADAKGDYKKIKRLQEQTLRQMKLATRDLRKNPKDKELIYELIRLDSKFHRNWAGNDPTMQRVIAFVVSNHQQLFMRLVLAQDAFEAAGLPLPDGFPSLADVVDSFHGECLEIFNRFLAVGDEIDPETKLPEGQEELEDAIRNHPKNGFTHVEAAVRLEEAFRRRK